MDIAMSSSYCVLTTRASMSSCASSSCASTVRFDLDWDVAEDREIEASDASTEAALEDASVPFEVGTRVATLCTLQSPNGKRMHPPGPGRVAAMYDNGVLVVAMDNEAVDTCLVLAEVEDVRIEHGGILPVGSVVRARGLIVNAEQGEAEIPAFTPGEVLQYYPQSGTYDVAYWSLNAMVGVPGRVLHLVSLPKRPDGPLLKRVAHAMANAGKKVKQTAARRLSPPAQRLDFPTWYQLQKQPTYSNLRGSPRGTFRSVTGSPRPSFALKP